MSILSTFLLALLAAIAAFLAAGVLITGIRFIPNSRLGIVEKRFSGRGSLKSGLIALGGEAGYEPEVLRGGVHFLAPFQYRIHSVPLVTIPQGQVGYVFARDGRPLDATQVLGSNLTADDFQDVRAFLGNDGQRGPQRKVLREGTYAVNLAQFAVITESTIYMLPLDREDNALFKRMADVITERGGFRPVVIKGSEDVIGIVTVHDGPSLPQGHIIAPLAGDDVSKPLVYHNNFQDPEKFLAGGGLRGRQYQVLVEGTYYINRLFATVELIPKTVIEVGNVGVVISYVGEPGADLSGKDYSHGELVAQGQRGVWSMPLMPGKYAFNTYAGKVVPVPTTNFILKWNRSEVGAHHFDENLAEVSLITKDAFEPSLPLSVVVHIDYRKAPLVVQRFGDVKRLVEQTLDPMVSAYFKNIGQTRTLIELIQERSEIQQVAGHEMKAKFEHYNLELEEVLIGTPSSSAGDSRIDDILTQLRERQIAAERATTYIRQQETALKERDLREAEARARQQQAVTESEVAIVIQTNQGRAEYQRAVQQAAQIRTLAEAEAEKSARTGIGEAIAIDEKVRAYGGPQYQVTQAVMSRFAEAIERARIDVVPRVIVGGGSASGGSNLMEALLTMLLSEKVGVALQPSPRSVEVETMRQQIRESMNKTS